MREENVTKAILNWLEANDWEIICFDFPQSGTGYILHPNEEYRTTKNYGAIIPDIVAIKNGNVVFFENKDRFVLLDFEKVHGLITNNFYSDSISRLLNSFSVAKIYYGIGIPYSNKNLAKSNQHLDKIDFIIFVKDDLAIEMIDNCKIYK